MTIRTFAAAALALSLLSPAAFAANNPNLPAGSEVTNQMGDYGVDLVDVGSTKAFAVASISKGKKNFNTGDYIDETNVERSQRSSR